MDTRVAAIDHLSPDHQRLFVEFGVGTRQSPEFECVHHAFEARARTQPDAIAAEHLGDTITYSQLDRCGNRLATRLREMGVKPGVRVCLLVQRSIPMVVAIVAILKAGGAYVPLDGSIVTKSTLDHVVHDSGSLLVLALREYQHRVPDIPVLTLDDYADGHGMGDCIKPEDLSSPSDSAYIIYTSGTTGKPKGVDVMHRNVTNLVCLAPGNIGMGPGRRVSQLMNIAFDMAAWEILGSLCNGSTLCIRGKSSKEWRAVMKTVDIVIATPSMMVPHNPADYPNIQTVATAGEPLPPALPDAWVNKNGLSRWTTGCGPTEVTIVNTIQPRVKGSDMSIGRPTPNNNVYILDENLRAVPIGEVGVMFAGGRCVSRGYINLPEKTQERYKLDPFMNDGSYMFDTGDLGRWRPDGTLDHLGRVDDQVKVKGFRVELDGVAAAMETCPSVKVAVALLVDSELWGFVTPSNVDVNAVLEATAKVQPYYAVPTRFVVLADLPRTGNDKTDKKALRRLALEKIEDEKAIIVDEKENLPPVSLPTLFKDSPAVETAIAKPAPVYNGVPLQGDMYLQRNASDDPSKSDQSASVSSTEISPSSLEKGNIWDGYQEDVLPEKTQGKYMRNIRHQIFSLYRRLFGVIFVTNMAIFISILARGGTNAKHLGLIVVANLFCAILMRQDYVINAFFNTFCAVPRSSPLWIRRICARVYSIGGLHSGSAISGIVWLIYFAGQATKEMLTGGPTSVATVVITYWILLLLLGIVVHAYPTVRRLKHNRFEATHRLLGWSATALVWVQVVLLTNDYRQVGQSLGHALVHSPPFWMVAVMTVSLILPWLRLRKVPVRAEVLSNHAVRLYFDYVTPKAGSFTRISDSPLMEWHGFATVPEPGKTGYSLVVSRAGDWTSKQIAEPPKELWVRGIPTFGVLRIVPIFRRIVLVATGSGIGPCTPCILEQRIPIRLLWTSPNVRQTFGDKLVDAILEKAPDAVIYDTRAHGKPDMVKLTYRLVKEFDAEAVCIISNQKLTQKVVYGMMSRGIPAFGAIWDS
ncbi:nonribosomal peptide synthetase 12 [Dentipellis sp. KUC8613]|nr:nonribosomal peptide synthetase 12 [Dentipellis sp. KUC8613]